ncbi:hypothetical protein AJ79_08989 [Helicocarpus griseus UAMH5409]|uniref:PD-(D/E)XK nuclease-like domain-containing protein n=1 Tax=Helicocarpus griseus UAMH5409 TaxID=1447875 RepID=A0A2B7WNJ5_9EURO|nr:hypothetical protein AJ79_08989 [Helicocarpus griseus UAMH5409]
MSQARCDIISDWLDACEEPAFPAPADIVFVAPSLAQRKRKHEQISSEVGSLTSCVVPQRLESYSRTAPPSVMDDRSRQTWRGRRGVTTRSQSKQTAAAPAISPGEDPSSSEQAMENVATLDQRQPPQSWPAVSSRLDVSAPPAITPRPPARPSVGHPSMTSHSLSPTKKISDLRTANPPIDIGVTTPVPQIILDLSKKFASINNNGFGIFPGSLKSKLEKADNIDYPDIFFEDPDITHTYDNLEVFQKLRSLAVASLRCHSREKPETSWAEEVFYPLLKLAVELENMNNTLKVQVENVATSHISPKHLMPTGLQNLEFSSKRVDYCIYLSQTADEESDTREILALRDVDIFTSGINQAGSSYYVKWLPQLAAVECKNDHPDTEGAVQLGIWMTALRMQLEGLVESKKRPTLKPMPCVKILGWDWYMYWCFVGEKGETVLYGPNDLGSTKGMKGTYQILKALREIVKYGREEYWPWFKETILWGAN